MESKITMSLVLSMNILSVCLQQTPEKSWRVLYTARSVFAYVGNSGRPSENRAEIKIYDPTSGSGSLLINIGKSVAKFIDNENNIKYYAQELKQNTYNLTRMNLVMRGILPDNIVTRNGDTLEDDWPYFDENDPVGTYDPLYVDAVVSNPPYSQAWNPIDKETDPRYARLVLHQKEKQIMHFYYTTFSI